MATITTDTYLDGGTARTAGETWNINGCVLTIRTDTRWHANAPASMTGSLGSVYLSTTEGGGLYIDGTKVRWLPFNSGSGTVPAIGTNVTQGGASGYLLGVWADYTSAPIAIGASMPTTGFIKFREVTGAFSSGALSGISASATGPDAVGWIECAHEANIVSSIFGLGVKAEGAWFDLGTTSGSAGQIVQLPTNGGGSGTHVSAIQIETAVGSGVFEWYPALVANGTTGGFHVNALDTDIRAKYVNWIGNGAVRIGSDGTNNVGYTPVAGLKIRCPNIFIRQTSSANRAVNTGGVAATSRSNCNGNYARWDLKNVDMNLRLMPNNTPTSFSVIDSCFEPYVTLYPKTLSGVGYAVNIAQGYNIVSISGSNAFGITLDAGGGAVVDKLVTSAIANVTPLRITGMSGLCNITNVRAEIVLQRTSAATAVQSDARFLTMTNLELVGGRLVIRGASDAKIYNVDFINDSKGQTSSTGGATQIVQSLSAPSTNILVDGITFGKNGQINGVHPYGALADSSVSVSNFIVRNAGTRASPLDVGTTSSTYPQAVFSSNQLSGAVKLQRLYLANSRSGAFIPNNIPLGSSILAENIYTGASVSYGLMQSGVTFKGCYMTQDDNTNNTPRFDCAFSDLFKSDTTGSLTLVYAAATNESAYISASFVGTSGFNATGGCTFNYGLGSVVTFEMPYFAKGHTGFQNAAFSFQGSNQGSFSFEYQIDTGSGYGGSWLILNGANLSSHSVNPSIGFKLKIRTTCMSNAASTIVTRIIIPTTSSLSAQNTNLYPLDTSTLSFTGLQPGSEVRCYTGSDPATAVEIGGIESTSGSTFSFSHSSGGSVGFIRIFALGYQPVTYDPFTFSSSDQTILVQQVVDRNYSNPA